MLTNNTCRQRRMTMIPILEQLGLGDMASLDCHNKMLAIHMLQKALDLVQDTQDDVRYTITMTLASCCEDRDLYDESIYWYQKSLEGNADHIPPLHKLHVRGSLLVNLISIGNMPDAEDLLREMLTDSPGPKEATVYYDHAQALRLYFEAKVLCMEDDADQEEIKSAIDALLEICEGYDQFLLIQKLRCGAYDILARQSLGAGEYDRAITLFKKSAVAALMYRNRAKAAECRREISGICEAVGDEKRAWRQYRKYYRMSQRIYRRKSEEFSAYLLAKNNLAETDRELSALREMKEYLIWRRNTDPLTGVCNRRFWNEALEEKAAASGPEDVYSILMLDIDSFKEYNDTFGHLEGDRVLKAIGGLLGGCVRADQDVLARFGGDEFVILTAGMGESESKSLADRILTCIRDYSLNGKEVSLTLSIGIATGSPGGERGFSDMLNDADGALYHSKQHGKNRSTHSLDIEEVD